MRKSKAKRVPTTTKEELPAVTRESVTRDLTVIIPSFKPDEKLEFIVSELEKVGFCDIVVVNDGSGSDYDDVFRSVAEHTSVTLLTHDVNRGKGAALKTAFRYVTNERPDRFGVITADGDAQHRASDIFACGEKMLQNGDKLVLGVRDFSLPSVPTRSRRGNRITSLTFRVLCGLKISDTQTGLRAIPSQYLADLCRIDGERYEYETNALLAMKNLGIPYCEQKIETVYINENQTSHFRPVRDSLRIYSLILKFVFSSFASTLIDLAAFYVFSRIATSAGVGANSVVIATAAARAVSSCSNFLINRSVVFRSELGVGKTLLKYYALAVPVALISAYGVKFAGFALGIDNAIGLTLIKIVVDTVLYFVNFRIQREWVFSAKRK